MSILITGGAGYIGSHTSLKLLENNFQVIIIDNFSNSSSIAIERVEALADKKITSYDVDLLDKKKVKQIFEQHDDIEAVIHFASLKSVGESTKFPLSYFYNNINGSLILLDVMKQHNIKNLIFSSSATVYGLPEEVPINENAKIEAINPYGRTKIVIEDILRDLYFYDEEWSISILRYFNPIGAHSSGLIGEAPNGIPNNLLPYITQVASGQLSKVHVFGGDYPTIDGTGVRDYIHVEDLAEGHLKALEKSLNTHGLEVYNLGTGKGYSVLEVITAFEEVFGGKIPYEIVERRSGDISICYANPEKAEKELGWESKKNLYQMCLDTWNWKLKNPNGYE
ncbi:UDP-glucose 4-epimerase GalE [Salibacterium sp. K-3]